MEYSNYSKEDQEFIDTEYNPSLIDINSDITDQEIELSIYRNYGHLCSYGLIFDVGVIRESIWMCDGGLKEVIDKLVDSSLDIDRFIKGSLSGYSSMETIISKVEKLVYLDCTRAKVLRSYLQEHKPKSFSRYETELKTIELGKSTWKDLKRSVVSYRKLIELDFYDLLKYLEVVYDINGPVSIQDHSMAFIRMVDKIKRSNRSYSLSNYHMVYQYLKTLPSTIRTDSSLKDIYSIDIVGATSIINKVYETFKLVKIPMQNSRDIVYDKDRVSKFYSKTESYKNKPVKTYTRDPEGVVKCYNCNNFGHIAKDCTKPDRKSKKPSKSSSSSSSSSSKREREVEYEHGSSSYKPSLSSSKREREVEYEYEHGSSSYKSSPPSPPPSSRREYEYEYEHGSPSHKSSSYKPSKSDNSKSTIKCNYCKKEGHLINNCKKLHYTKRTRDDEEETKPFKKHQYIHNSNKQ